MCEEKMFVDEDAEYERQRELDSDYLDELLLKVIKNVTENTRYYKNNRIRALRQAINSLTFELREELEKELVFEPL